MPFEYIDEIAIADVAFAARAGTLEELFVTAVDAVLNVMVADLSTVVPLERRAIRLESDAVDMLLFALLQEIIFYKDAERLLLRVPEAVIRMGAAGFVLEAEARGEEIDASKHELLVDVKAVTLHRYGVAKTPSGWEAFVILDV